MISVKSFLLTFTLLTVLFNIPKTFSNPFNIPTYSEDNLHGSTGALLFPLPHDLCEPCKVLAKKLDGVLDGAQAVPCMAAVVTALCNRWGAYTPDVCEGTGNSFAPSLTYAFANNLALPSSLCGAIVENCGNGKEFPDWNVTFPNTPKPPIVTPTLPPNGTRTYRILHLSDIHYDQFYSPGTEANCDEPLCCRDQFGKGKNITAGYWGTAAKCDMPLWTIDNLFQHLRDNETWDWMVWTGDMPPHDIWNQTKDEQLYVLNTIYGLLYKYLADETIFFAVGNHESAPADSFPPHFANLPPDADISWLYDTLAYNWTHWIPTHNVDNIKSWLYANDTDPDGALAWLINQLQDAEDNGIKVHIIGHAPSGDRTCITHWSRNYYNIINRYESTVAGQFFGHTHSDQFSVFYEDADITGRATEVMYVAPSVTTYSWRMPTYRVYTLDSLSFEVLDTETYMLNVTEANISNKTDWVLEYKASESYDMKSLFPEDWNSLINTFAANSTMFNLYYKHFDRNDKICDDECQYTRLCEMRSGRSHDKENLCYDLPYANLSRHLMLDDDVSIDPSKNEIIIPDACFAATTIPASTTPTPASTTTAISQSSKATAKSTTPSLTTPTTSKKGSSSSLHSSKIFSVFVVFFSYVFRKLN